jgi:hypothetical protein
MNKQPSNRTDPSAKATEDEQLRKEIYELLQRVDSLPTVDPRPEDEILDYDASGVPA